MNVPNELNIYRYYGGIFFLGIRMPFFIHTLCDEFDKMQIPRREYRNIPHTVYGSFGDNRSLRFCAAASTVALFIFCGDAFHL